MKMNSGTLFKALRRVGDNAEARRLGDDAPATARGPLLSALTQKQHAEDQMIGTAGDHLRNAGPDLTILMTRIGWDLGEGMHPAARALLAGCCGVSGLVGDAVELVPELALAVGRSFSRGAKLSQD